VAVCSITPEIGASTCYFLAIERNKLYRCAFDPDSCRRFPDQSADVMRLKAHDDCHWCGIASAGEKTLPHIFLPIRRRNKNYFQYVVLD
jgi:hypothetical protein